MFQLRQSDRPKTEQCTDASSKECDNAIDNNTTSSKISDKDYQSAIAKHLPVNNCCAKIHYGECFNILLCARLRKHLCCALYGRLVNFVVINFRTCTLTHLKFILTCCFFTLF